MIDINKKYFGYIGRFVLMNTKDYHLSASLNGKDIRGMHLFLGKLYICIYIRIGERR